MLWKGRTATLAREIAIGMISMRYRHDIYVLSRDAHALYTRVWLFAASAASWLPGRHVAPFPEGEMAVAQMKRRSLRAFRDSHGQSVREGCAEKEEKATERSLRWRSRVCSGGGPRGV